MFSLSLLESLYWLIAVINPLFLMQWAVILTFSNKIIFIDILYLTSADIPPENYSNCYYA